MFWATTSVIVLSVYLLILEGKAKFLMSLFIHLNAHM